MSDRGAMRDRGAGTGPGPRPEPEGWRPLRLPVRLPDGSEGGSVLRGVYEDRNGGLRFCVPELLAAFGWADNAGNRRIVEEEVRSAAGRFFPDAAVEVRE